jgi:hypothetical protein
MEARMNLAQTVDQLRSCRSIRERIKRDIKDFQTGHGMLEEVTVDEINAVQELARRVGLFHYDETIRAVRKFEHHPVYVLTNSEYPKEPIYMNCMKIDLDFGSEVPLSFLFSSNPGLVCISSHADTQLGYSTSIYPYLDPVQVTKNNFIRYGRAVLDTLAELHNREAHFPDYDPIRHAIRVSAEVPSELASLVMESARAIKPGKSLLHSDAIEKNVIFSRISYHPAARLYESGKEHAVLIDALPSAGHPSVDIASFISTALTNPRYGLSREEMDEAEGILLKHAKKTYGNGIISAYKAAKPLACINGMRHLRKHWLEDSDSLRHARNLFRFASLALPETAYQKVLGYLEPGAQS